MGMVRRWESWRWRGVLLREFFVQKVLLDGWICVVVFVCNLPSSKFVEG